MTANNTFRKWFSFSLRELVLLVAMIGIALGWYVDHNAQSEEHVQLIVQFIQDKAARMTAPVNTLHLRSSPAEARIDNIEPCP